MGFSTAAALAIGATAGAAGGVAISSLTSSSPKAPAAPPPPPPPSVMPTPDDAAVQAAKRTRLLQQASRTGRASTMLTDQARDTLGGGSGDTGTSDKLGG